jgi:lipase maturation factor 1
MNGSLDRPTVVFDGECSFCRAWIEHWQQLTGNRVLYTPYQELSPEVNQETASLILNLPRKDLLSAVTLFLPGGEMRRGAHAVFSLLALLPDKSWILWAYLHIPGFAPIAELAYRMVARHRFFCYWGTRALWGIPVEVETFRTASWLFLRTLGAAYLFAFDSFAAQAPGLIASRGI